jgi:hypothetical protein
MEMPTKNRIFQYVGIFFILVVLFLVIDTCKSKKQTSVQNPHAAIIGIWQLEELKFNNADTLVPTEAKVAYLEDFTYQMLVQTDVPQTLTGKYILDGEGKNIIIMPDRNAIDGRLKATISFTNENEFIIKGSTSKNTIYQKWARSLEKLPANP